MGFELYEMTELRGDNRHKIMDVMTPGNCENSDKAYPSLAATEDLIVDGTMMHGVFRTVEGQLSSPAFSRSPDDSDVRSLDMNGDDYWRYPGLANVALALGLPKSEIDQSEANEVSLDGKIFGSSGVRAYKTPFVTADMVLSDEQIADLLNRDGNIDKKNIKN